MAEVEIEYCVPCGLLDDAVRVQRQLLTEYGRALDGVRLATGHGGVFEIRVDGELVFDGQESTYDADAFLDEVRQRLPEEASA